MKNLHFPWLFPWKPPFFIGKFPTSLAPAHPWHRSSIKARNSMPSKIMEPPRWWHRRQTTYRYWDKPPVNWWKIGIPISAIYAFIPIDIDIGIIIPDIIGILPSIVKIWKNWIVYPNWWPLKMSGLKWPVKSTVQVTSSIGRVWTTCLYRWDPEFVWRNWKGLISVQVKIHRFL